MSDRFSSPIQTRVRFITIASVLSLSMLAGRVASAKPSVPQPPPATPDAAVAPPAGEESPQANSRGTVVVTVEAWDDETGTLKPAPNVIVRAESDLERPRYQITDADGRAYLRLNTGRYKIVVTSAQYQRDEKFLEVHQSPAKKDDLLPGQSWDQVHFTLYTRVDTVTLPLPFVLLDREEVGNTTKLQLSTPRFIPQRGLNINAFPVGVGNRQSVGKILRSVPGFAEDSLNQVHPRGENAIATATMLDGVLIPRIAAGQIAQFLLPQSIDTINARVGGFAPEFGGGSGAVLDIKTRQPNPTGRYLDFNLFDGDFNTTSGYLSFGNVLPANGKMAGRGLFKRFRYDITLSERVTDEATNPSQDTKTNSRNYGVSDVAFVKGTFDLAPGRSISAIGNLTSGRNGIVNRTGFLSSFQRFGAGFGFLGERNFNGQGPVSLTPPVGVQNQEDLGQDFRQKDNTSLIMLQVKNQSPKGAEQMVSVGVLDSSVFIGDRGTRTKARMTNLPQDSSIEYLPTVLNDYSQLFAQASYSSAEPAREASKTHHFKFGFVYHNLDGLDSYQFIPQSILALDELYAIDPRLAPSLSQMETQGIDARGNIKFKPLNQDINVPVLFATRTGTYGAFYGQDTYKINPLFRLNFGWRYDTFQQTTVFSTNNPDYVGRNSERRSASLNTLSPRINGSYVFQHGPRLGGLLRPVDILFKPLRGILNEQAIVRVSYNRMVAPPETGQGYFTANQRNTGASASIDPATFTSAPVPQVVDQLDLSVERQIGDFTFAKFGIYSKTLHDTLQMRSLLTPLQAGMLSTLNLGGGIDDGIEFGIETHPRFKNGTGFDVFLSFANSSTQPKDTNQFTNLAGGAKRPVERVNTGFYEFDQTNTLSGGVAYAFRNGGTAGLSFMMGSGLYSSKLSALPTDDLPVLTYPVRTGGRQQISEVNLRLATPPNFLYRTKTGGGLGLELSVENLFDSVGRFNWRGPVGGTRYQQGRRIFIGINGRL